MRPKQKLNKTSPMGMLRCGLINQSATFSCPVSGKMLDYRMTEVIVARFTDTVGTPVESLFLVHHDYTDKAIEAAKNNLNRIKGVMIQSVSVLTESELMKGVE